MRYTIFVIPFLLLASVAVAETPQLSGPQLFQVVPPIGQGTIKTYSWDSKAGLFWDMSPIAPSANSRGPWLVIPSPGAARQALPAIVPVPSNAAIWPSAPVMGGDLLPLQDPQAGLDDLLR